MKKSLLVFLVLTAMCLTIGCNKKSTEAVQPEAIIIEGLQWSEKSPKTMNWGKAVIYCENLNEDNRKDWRLPNIDELRTLIKNCPGPQTGGSCAVSDPNHLAGDNISDDCHCEYKENNGGYYSKLGDDDKVWLWSSSTSLSSSSFAWGVNFNGKLVTNRYNGSMTDDNYVRCVRNSSHSDSKKTSTKSDDSNNKKETTETKKLQWSEKTQDKKNHNDAMNYCKNLSEGGHKDWRVPNIDELRTLIKDRKTVTGGKCKVSEKNACLSVIDCFNAEDCAEGCKPFDDEGDRTWVCKGECKEPDCKLGEGCYFDCNYTSSGGKYSKLGDTATFISSSIATQSEYGDQNFWTVNFNTGRITDEYAANVRCVRDTK